MSLTVAIKRFDPELPLPSYQSEHAAAVDLYARLDTTVPAHAIGYVPLNIALELPENYWALLAARSSLHKKGLMLANGIGIGDRDFCGDGDEYTAAVLNFTDQKVEVKRGERIAQLLILPQERVEFVEKKQFETKNRGGFGSTGK